MGIFVLITHFHSSGLFVLCCAVSIAVTMQHVVSSAHIAVAWL